MRSSATAMSADTPSFQPATTPGKPMLAPGSFDRPLGIERDPSARSGLTKSSSGEITLLGGAGPNAGFDRVPPAISSASRSRERGHESRSRDRQQAAFETAPREKERQAMASLRRGGDAPSQTASFSSKKEVDIATSLVNYKRKTARGERGERSERGERENGGSAARERKSDRDSSRDPRRATPAVNEQQQQLQQNSKQEAAEDLAEDMSKLRVVPRGLMGDRGTKGREGRLFDPSSGAGSASGDKSQPRHHHHHHHQHIHHHQHGNKSRDPRSGGEEEGDEGSTHVPKAQRGDRLRPSSKQVPEDQRSASRRDTWEEERETSSRRPRAGDLRGDASSSTHGASSAAGGGGGQLFDPRRHDPVKFAIQKRGAPNDVRGTPASSSAASNTAGTMTPSDARSMLSSLPPASSATSRSTAPSVTSSEASKERRRRRNPANASSSSAHGGEKDGKGHADAAPSAGAGNEVNSYVMDLKRAYREITQLEAKLQEEHKTTNSDKGRTGSTQLLESSKSTTPSVDHDVWLKLTAQHRQLAELHEAFMEMALRPGLPASLHSLPQNYNIPTRLWQTGFHLMLERLRHALPYPQQSQVPSDEASAAVQAQLLDHLTEFIYFAYSFYTNLLESEFLRVFKSAWIESLGDLARYRMAVAGLSSSLNTANRIGGVRNKARRALHQAASPAGRGSPALARIDDDDDVEEAKKQKVEEENKLDGASIGSDALGDWELEEKETWRITARDWYAKGLAEMPGTGRLQHHLGVLSRQEELRALHHFCRSLTASHPFLSARESILPLFDAELQAKRNGPDASISELFVCLHGMVFTRIQLDDFDPVFEKFLDALDAAELDSRASPTGVGSSRITQATWMMMATTNVAALLQHGAEDAILASAASAGAGAPATGSSRKTERPEAKVPTAIILNHNKGSSPPSSPKAAQQASLDQQDNNILKIPNKPSKDVSEEDVPLALRYALRLTFTTLSRLIERTITSQTPRPLNPYLTIILTFLATVAKQSPAFSIIERWIPWEAIIRLSFNAPHLIDPRKDISSKITGSSPLPEDWCLRGMAWVGRKVYERGFWKPQRSVPGTLNYESEVDVLTREDSMGEGEWAGENFNSEGDDDQAAILGEDAALSDLRWRRVSYCIATLAKTIPGVDFDDRTRAITIVEPLRSKIERWAIEEEQERAPDHARPAGHFDVDSEEEAESSSDSEEDDQDDESLPQEIRDLKARRRYLKSVIKQAKVTAASLAAGPPSRTKKPKAKRSSERGQKSTISAVAGYTVLILDTNILLAPGKLLEDLIESKRWTVVIPLAVITELDGLQKNPEPLGPRAKAALHYTETHIRSHGKWLKVQTSRGNYLPDLTVRSEDIDFGKDDGEETRARSLDEIILRAVNWQQAHFVDRLAILSDNPFKDREKVKEDTAKAVLVTLDRNLRLKARARGLPAATQKEITHILASS